MKEAKRDDKIKIIGFDGQLDGKQAIKDGKLRRPHPASGQDAPPDRAADHGYQAGEKFASETLIPATLYTKTEADQIQR